MDRFTSISRRTVLSKTVGALAGLGLLSEVSPHKSHETAQAQSASTTSNWPQYKANAGHSARVDAGIGPTGDIKEMWKNNAVGSRQGIGGVAVVDQTVYVGGDDLIALDATNGQERWAFEPEIPEGIDSGSDGVSTNVGQPAVMNDTVYVSVGFKPYEVESNTDPVLIAVDAHTGKRRWRVDTDGGYLPYHTVTAAAGSVMTSLRVDDATTHQLTVFTADGEKRWQQRFEVDHADPIIAPPVTDGRVYVPTPNVIKALDVATGDEVWSSLSTGESMASAMVDNGTLFVAEGGVPETLTALDAATGKVHWRTAVRSVAASAGLNSMMTADETSVYVRVNSSLTTISALNRADGSERWHITPEMDWEQNDDISLDGVALVGGVLYCGTVAFDPSNGETIWRHPMDETENDWHLGAVAGGRVYLYDKTLAVLTGTTEPPSTETATRTSTTPETTTTAATTTSTASETTTTDGPGFGVLPAVAGVGLLAWRSLTKR